MSPLRSQIASAMFCLWTKRWGLVHPNVSKDGALSNIFLEASRTISILYIRFARFADRVEPPPEGSH